MPPPKRHADEFDVNEDLVRRLLHAQFPEWDELPLALVEPTGTDHTLYRLGDEMVVRMPIMEYATRQAAREARWLPFLAPQVPLELPVPLAMGQPGEGYPWTWSVVSWIDGERADPTNVDLGQAAVDLARFIKALQACDPTDGPRAGRRTGLRGLSLRGWEGPISEAIRALDGVYDTAAGEARELFFEEVGLDDATRLRAKGWALGPAFVGLSYYRDVPHLQANAHISIEGALAD